MYNTCKLFYDLMGTNKERNRINTHWCLIGAVSWQAHGTNDTAEEGLAVF